MGKQINDLISFQVRFQLCSLFCWTFHSWYRHCVPIFLIRMVDPHVLSPMNSNGSGETISIRLSIGVATKSVLPFQMNVSCNICIWIPGRVVFISPNGNGNRLTIRYLTFVDNNFPIFSDVILTKVFFFFF